MAKHGWKWRTEQVGKLSLAEALDGFETGDVETVLEGVDNRTVADFARDALL